MSPSASEQDWISANSTASSTASYQLQGVLRFGKFPSIRHPNIIYNLQQLVKACRQSTARSRQPSQPQPLSSANNPCRAQYSTRRKKEFYLLPHNSASCLHTISTQLYSSPTTRILDSTLSLSLEHTEDAARRPSQPKSHLLHRGHHRYFFFPG